MVCSHYLFYIFSELSLTKGYCCAFHYKSQQCYNKAGNFEAYDNWILGVIFRKLIEEGLERGLYY